MSKSQEDVADDPLWFKNAVIYELPVKAFFDSSGDGIGDFKGLTSRLDYLEDLGVTALWLLPFYPSPLRDDGYDISDYGNIHSQYGSMKDFRQFLRQAHRRGIRVIIELVLNHTSDQHEWFQKSRRSPPASKWRNFYVWSNTPKKYSEARIIFKDFETSNWSWDPQAGAYYWHRFYSHQPDLNYDSVDTQKAIMSVVDRWLAMGVDGLRLDAVPYLYEQDGTNCENLPATHSFLKKLRSHIDSKYKNRVLLAEANQWPSDAVAYFGRGDECHMAFHFPLMPRMFMAIELQDSFPITDIFDHTPQIPEGCQWALFLRNHDELTLEMVTDEERDYMYRVYARDGQARINLGIRRRLAPLLGNDRRKIELMNVLLFTLPGTPVVYYGDEIGMGDNYSLGDRNGVRTPMQWGADVNAGFSRANPQKLYLPVIIDPEYNYEAVNVENQVRNPNSLLSWMKQLIKLRRSTKAFGQGSINFLFNENNKVLAYIREFQEERLLVVVNLSRNSQVAELDLTAYEGFAVQEVFGRTKFPRIEKSSYTLTFDPYAYYIFSLATPEAGVAPQIITPDIHLEKSLAELFKEKQKRELETIVIPAYLKRARWFRSRSHEIEVIRIRDVLNLPSNRAEIHYMLIFDVFYNEGLPEAYTLPLAYAPHEAAARIIADHPEAVVACVHFAGQHGIIFDGLFDRDFRNGLLQLVQRRRSIRGRLGELEGLPTELLRGILPAEQGEVQSEVLSVEQSNSSIIYGSNIILKFYRRTDEGVNPELEISHRLHKMNFEGTPPLLGEISYLEKGAEPVVIAKLDGFVRNQGTALKYCLDHVTRYLEIVRTQSASLPDGQPSSLVDSVEQGHSEELVKLVGKDLLDSMEKMGARTGEFHRALLKEGEQAEFQPEPFTYLYRVALSQSMISHAKRTLMRAARTKNLSVAVRSELEKVVANQNIILERFRLLISTKIEAVKSRIHGAYGLNELLFTGNEFLIIDFEGDPSRPLSERRLKRTPLKDVASFIRSLHYLAYSTLLQTVPADSQDYAGLAYWVELWYKQTSIAFLRGYMASVADTGIIPKERSALSVLLDALILEKAMHELDFELSSSPDKSLIPLLGITSILGI